MDGLGGALTNTPKISVFMVEFFVRMVSIFANVFGLLLSFVAPAMRIDSRCLSPR